jgi:hypothetical protein
VKTFPRHGGEAFFRNTGKTKGSVMTYGLKELSKLKLTPELAEQLSRGRALLLERDRLADAMAKEAGTTEQRRAALAQAETRLAIESSREDATLEGVRAARQSMEDARELLDFSLMRTRGLTQKLEACRRDLVAAADEANRLKGRAAAAIQEGFRTQRFLPAVEAFKAVVLEAKALWDGLGIDDVNLEQLQVFDLSTDRGRYRERLIGVQPTTSHGQCWNGTEAERERIRCVPARGPVRRRAAIVVINAGANGRLKVSPIRARAVDPGGSTCR